MNAAPMTPWQLGWGIACGLIITFQVLWILDALFTFIARRLAAWQHRRWLRRERALRTTREEDHD